MVKPGFGTHIFDIHIFYERLEGPAIWTPAMKMAKLTFDIGDIATINSRWKC